MSQEPVTDEMIQAARDACIPLREPVAESAVRAAIAAALAEMPVDARREQSLAMMIRMLCSYGNTSSMKEKAMALLRSYNLQGSPLRDTAGVGAPSAAPEQQGNGGSDA